MTMTSQQNTNSNENERRLESKPSKPRSNNNEDLSLALENCVLEENEFEVEKILGKRFNIKHEEEYLVKWLGYPHSESTWECKENILSSHLITEYEASLREDATNKHVYFIYSGTERVEVILNDDAFKDGLKPVEILGVTNSGGMWRFLLRFENNHKYIFVSAEVVKKNYPELVIDYYESKCVFK